MDKNDFRIMYFVNGDNTREVRIVKERYFRINSGKMHHYTELTNYIKEMINKGWSVVDLHTYLRKKYGR